MSLDTHRRYLHQLYLFRNRLTQFYAKNLRNVAKKRKTDTRPQYIEPAPEPIPEPVLEPIPEPIYEVVQGLLQSWKITTGLSDDIRVRLIKSKNKTHMCLHLAGH